MLSEFEAKLIPEISGLVNQDNDQALLNVQNLIEIIDWIEYYIGMLPFYDLCCFSLDCLPPVIAQMDSYSFNELKSVQEFRKIADDLLNDYLHQIKTQGNYLSLSLCACILLF